jgi:hypothetical protein
MRRLPPKAPLLPALAAASGVAAGFIIFAVATDWTGVANNMLHAAARVTALIPAVMPWLHAATGSALRYAAALHDQLPALAVAACAFYLAALAGLATLASALKPRI